MKNSHQTKSDPHDQDNQLPKDVLNLAQDPDSFRDPLAVQGQKTESSQQNNLYRKEGKNDVKKRTIPRDML